MLHSETVSQTVKKIKTGQDILKHFLGDAYIQSRPLESSIDCDKCNASQKSPPKYLQTLKCCTFHPYLPNYLVGLALQDPAQKKFHEWIEDKIANHGFILPVGVVAPPEYQHRFSLKSDHDFGHSADLLCPFFNRLDLNCSIWPYRNSVCQTFFCDTDRGQAGLDYWEKSDDFLSYMEMALMEEVLIQMDFSPRQLSEQLPFMKMQEWTLKQQSQACLSEVEYKKIWNGYAGEEIQFFIKSAEIVSGLSQAQFREALGDTGKSLVKNLKSVTPRASSGIKSTQK